MRDIIENATPEQRLQEYLAFSKKLTEETQNAQKIPESGDLLECLARCQASCQDLIDLLRWSILHKNINTVPHENKLIIEFVRNMDSFIQITTKKKKEQLAQFRSYLLNKKLLEWLSIEHVTKIKQAIKELSDELGEESFDD